MENALGWSCCVAYHALLPCHGRDGFLNSDKNPDLVGATFADIGRMRNTTPFDAALDLMLEEGELMNGLMWTSHSFDDSDIEL